MASSPARTPHVPTHGPAVERLRVLYTQHLLTPIQGRKGTIAGKQTRRGMRAGAQWAAETAPAWQALADAYLDSPDRVWVWSDHHLGHENIIAYAGRPHGSVHYMDASLLAAAQEHVAPGDWLLFVGDLAMWYDAAANRRWLEQCPGRKALVLGNHDVRGREYPEDLATWQDLGFEAVADVAVLPAAHDLPELWATHYPLARALLPAGVANLHGHTHAHRLPGPYVSACVEIVGYRPRVLVQWARQCLAQETPA